MSIARQFLVLAALCCTATFCALAGSALAQWITPGIHHSAAAVELPEPWLFNAPAGVQPRTHSPKEAKAHGREPAVDLYGNEVIDAVANYMLDSTGDLYEEHSPQTEVPRLEAPKS